MALRQIQKRYSKFIFDSFTHCKISTNPHPISKISPLQKRFYFKNREYDSGYFHNSKRAHSTLFLFSCGVAIAVSSGEWVTVPYSERSHFILFHKLLTNILPDERISFKGEPLPPLHPDSIAARKIYERIIDQALPLETEIKQSLEETLNKLALEVENEDKTLRIGFKTLYGEKQGELEGNREVIVVNSPVVGAASCGRFRKFYVTTALLDRYARYEEMIATIFGREVGRDLARHREEIISKFISVVSVAGMSVYLVNSYVAKFMPWRFKPSYSFVVFVALLSYLPMMKYWRDMVYEADEIGLMLASSGGYNPIVGLMFPVHGGVERRREFVLPECVYPVPTPGRRSLHLGHPKILTKAMMMHPNLRKPAHRTGSA